MPAPDPDDTADVLSAVLIQNAGHAERISNLDGLCQDISAAVRQLATDIATAQDRLGEVERGLADQAAVSASLASLDRQVAALAARLTELVAEGRGADGGSPY